MQKEGETRHQVASKRFQWILRPDLPKHVRKHAEATQAVRPSPPRECTYYAAMQRHFFEEKPLFINKHLDIGVRTRVDALENPLSNGRLATSEAQNPNILYRICGQCLYHLHNPFLAHVSCKVPKEN